jgi:hypothetical protein
MGFQSLVSETPADPALAWRAKDSYGAAQPAPGTPIKAAPAGAGQHHYVTDILISANASGAVKLVQDTGGAVSDVTPFLYFNTNMGASPNFQTRIRIAAGVDIGVVSTIAGAHSVMLQGYTDPA